jgi:poly(hydroxyalkanoate) depolymerase family esterase
MNETTMAAAMREATELTRAGRLTEATALLRRLLGGSSAPAATEAGPVIDLAPREDTAAPARPSAPRLPEALRGLVERARRATTAPGIGREAPSPETVVPAGGRFLAASHGEAAAGGARAYRLYLPSGYRGQPVPLVVMLHGCTQSPEDFAAGTRMNLLAEERTFLVAYPAQCQKANASRCWNWFSPGDQQRDRGEPALIAGITRRIMREHAVDPKRVYVAGLSAGGAAAAVLAGAYPDLFAAVGVHSGLPSGSASDVASAFAAMRQGDGPAAAARRHPFVPTIVFHGDQDATVHPRNGERVAEQAATAAAAAGLRTRVERGRAAGGHPWRRVLHADEGGRTVIERWVVEGAGHAWSGGSPAGSYTDPRGPDASREMLRFFLEHPRAEAGERP